MDSPTRKDSLVPEIATEHVLVVPTTVFHEIGHFQGFTADVDTYFARLLDPTHISYRPRDAMEDDPSFKQLIPYCLFRHTLSDGTPLLFQYTRGSGQGESRLHAKRSVGIGGHISREDAAIAGDDVYREGMRRELAEEVQIDTAYDETCVGLINDDETEVGRVHLGVVHVFDLAEPRVQSNEDDICETGFLPVDILLDDLDGFETWSQIVLKALFGGRT
jgi:predicted NUDIX family phosphoesterase